MFDSISRNLLYLNSYNYIPNAVKGSEILKTTFQGTNIEALTTNIYNTNLEYQQNILFGINRNNVLSDLTEYASSLKSVTDSIRGYSFGRGSKMGMFNNRTLEGNWTFSNPYGMSTEDFTTFVANKKDILDGNRVAAATSENTTLLNKYGITTDKYSYQDVANYLTSNTPYNVTLLNGAPQGSTTFRVEKLASVGSITSWNFKKTDSIDTITDVYSDNSEFMIKNNDTNQIKKLNLWSLGIDDRDSIYSAFQKIATGINNLHFGITARVETDSTDASKIRLVLNPDDPAGDFEVSDTYGWFSQTLGINIFMNPENYQQGSNMIYYENGVQKTSSTNSVLLADGFLRVDAKSVSSTDAVFTIKKDSGNMAQVLENFVYEYNRMTSFLKENEMYIRGDVTPFASSAVRLHASELASIGIQTNADGTLTIDSDKLNEAVVSKSDVIEELFTSPHNGIATDLQKLTTDITTSKYGAFARDEKEPTIQTFNNRFLISQMTNHYINGMLVDENL